MNKINIVNNKVIDYTPIKNLYINDYDKCKYLNISKDTLYIYIPNDTKFDIELICQYSSSQNIAFVLDKNSELNLFEFKTGSKLKGSITYILLDNARLKVNKFCNIDNLDELTNIKLNGLNSKVDYYFSTICKDNNIYNIITNHNNKKTDSNIICHGISLNNASLKFDLTGSIDNGNVESFLNQDSKIIVLGENKSVIEPKLLISEDEVQAKHAAVVGRFKDEELFYLKTRGLNEIDAINLLIKGFLTGVLDINIEQKYEILKQINYQEG